MYTDSYLYIKDVILDTDTLNIGTVRTICALSMVNS